jgi:hypothetical protein
MVVVVVGWRWRFGAQIVWMEMAMGVLKEGR